MINLIFAGKYFLMIPKPRILISPLNWGLGHASRCVPIIHELLRQDFDVMMGVDGNTMSFLSKEFPDVRYIEIPGLQIHYPKNSMIIPSLMLKCPQYISQVWKEYRIIQNAVKKFKIDAILSDNRYGIYCKNIPSIFITHQIQIPGPKQMKVFEKALLRFNKSLLKKFDEIWVPDFSSSNNLSGKLSHGMKLSEKVSYIGPLSRFNKEPEPNEDKELPEILAIISGPENQRTMFEEHLIDQLSAIGKKSLLIQGLPNNTKTYQLGNIEIHPHMDSKKMAYLIKHTPHIVCRSGYSTIMDLAALQRKAVLVPTPGQPEQVYLAERLEEQKILPYYRQNQLNLEEGFAKLEEYKGFGDFEANNNLARNINRLKKNIINKSYM